MTKITLEQIKSNKIRWGKSFSCQMLQSQIEAQSSRCGQTCSNYLEERLGRPSPIRSYLYNYVLKGFTCSTKSFKLTLVQLCPKRFGQVP